MVEEHNMAEGFYIVVENPALSGATKEHPVAGSRTNAVDLAVGRKVNIPGPCSFALSPGQAAEVIPGHHLRSKSQHSITNLVTKEVTTKIL